MPKKKKSMKINKLTITLIVLIVWAVVSVIYVANDYWKDFKMSQMQAAYSSGSTQTISQIVKKAKTCEPINLYTEEKEVNLIDVACLQQAGQKAGMKDSSETEESTESSE